MADVRNAFGNIAMAAGDFAVEKFGEDAEVGAVAVVMDVISGSPDGTARNYVSYYCNDPRMWVQEGLLAEALETCIDERDKVKDGADGGETKVEE